MFTNSNHFKLGSIMFCIMIYFMTVGILVTKKLKIIIFYLFFFSNHVTCTKGRKLYLHGILFLHILSPFYQHIRLIVSSNTSSDHLCAVMLLWDCKRVFNSWFRLIINQVLILNWLFRWIRGKNGTIICTMAWIK